jgi:hypothetical protein
MQYTFNVETKRNVNVVGDYSVVSYSAEYVGTEPLARTHFNGTVQVSPHDASPDEEITRDLAEQIRNLSLTTDGTATLAVEV